MNPSFRLALIPLDERPVNTKAPQQLARIAGCNVLLPPRHMLPHNKEVGNDDELGRWLQSVAPEVDGLIVSVETLAFGGLIPSRITHAPLSEALSRLDVLARIKAQHPNLPIYAFTLVMRIPAYDGDDEEPAYWAHYGQRIHRYSQLVDRVARHGDENDKAALNALRGQIPGDVLDDWHWRRERNHELSRHVVRLAADGVVDFLLITQDDSAEYGVSAAEQRVLRAEVAALNIEERAVLYPGADEVAMVLLARHVNKRVNKSPKYYPRYSSVQGPFIIPRYEDRPLAESVKGQVYAVGGRLVESPQEADVMLYLNTPGEAQAEAPHQAKATTVDTAGRNLLDFTESMLHYAEQGLPIAVADVAYSNGADLPFVSLLLRRVGLARLAAYGAWNTAGNTLGTVVAHAALVHAVGRDVPAEVKEEAAKAHLAFLLTRFVDDWAYQANVRTTLSETHLPARGINPWRLADRGPEAEQLVREQLPAFARAALAKPEYLTLSWYGEPLRTIVRDFTLHNIYLPWNRMFHVGFDLELML